MIHYVLASHGNYAREALNSAKMICGEDTDRMNLLLLPSYYFSFYSPILPDIHVLQKL